MKVLILSSDPRQGAGAERAVSNIIKALSNKIEFVVLFPKLKESLETAHDIAYDAKIIEAELPWGIKGKGIINNLKRRRQLINLTADYINNENPDIVLSNLSIVWHQVSIMLKVLIKINAKVILRFGNPLSQDITNRSFISKKVMSKYINQVDKVIANAPVIIDELKAQSNISLKKVKLILNPVDIKEVRRKSEQAVDEPSYFNTDKKIICSVGRLENQKNYSMLIKAFEKANTLKKYRLLIIGSGSLKNELEALTNELDQQDSIYFLGWKNNPYVYIKNSDLFVLPSLYEGTPNALLEAMACGTTILATETAGSVAEVVDHGRAGMICKNDYLDCARCITELMEHDARRSKLSEEANIQIQNFSLEMKGSEYYSTFKNLLN